MADKAKLDRDIMAGEAALAAVRQRLGDIKRELDALTADPVTPALDVDAEEAAALKRLARVEALRRVARGLELEQSAGVARIDALKAEVRKVEVARLRAEVVRTGEATAAALWAAYQAAGAWADAVGGLTAVVPFAWGDTDPATAKQELEALLVRLRLADQVTGPAGVRVARRE
jgi:hypothetical protein